MTILAQTLQLAFRIAFVWAAGILIAVAVRAVLPDETGLTLGGRNGFFIAYSRADFWTCILAALTVTGMVVIRAMLIDLGLRAVR